MNTNTISTKRRTFLKKHAVAGEAIGFHAVMHSHNPNSRVQLAAIGDECI
jgi:hypothetical protein